MEAAHHRFQIQVYQSAQVTPLTGACLAVNGQILSLTGKEMELELDQPVAARTAVRVQTRNWLMLGEVLYCVQERSRHRTRLRLEHALPGLRELTAMNRHFFGQTAREPLTEDSGYSGYT